MLTQLWVDFGESRVLFFSAQRLARESRLSFGITRIDRDSRHRFFESLLKTEVEPEVRLDLEYRVASGVVSVY